MPARAVTLNRGGSTDVRDPARQPGFDGELTSYGSYLHGLGAKFGLYETSGTAQAAFEICPVP